jgi:hypothetical protein
MVHHYSSWYRFTVTKLCTLVLKGSCCCAVKHNMNTKHSTALQVETTAQDVCMRCQLEEETHRSKSRARRLLVTDLSTFASWLCMASWCVCAANTPTRYTVRNGEQQVLGRTDKTMPQQCIITIGNDGTGTVTSVGMGSTGVRENTSTPWEWLSKNQSKVIADGTMISLDVNNPEGLIFTCQVADRNGTLIEQMNMNKRKRVDVEKGELLIVIRTRSYSHAHTHTLILARSYTHSLTQSHAHTAK